MPVVEEVTELLQIVTDLFNNNEMENSIPNPRILESTSISDSSTSAFLLSSIHTLSTLPAQAIPSPSLSQLYHTLTQCYKYRQYITIRSPWQYYWQKSG